MYKWGISIMASLVLFSCAGQSKEDTEMKKKAYHVLINTFLSRTVNEVIPEDIERTNPVFLDARDKKEFDISKIEGARFVGYEEFEISTVEDLEKNAEIIVYCSVSYRSEKITEKLEAQGFTNVSNMYGGIFDWYNAGLPVVDSLGNPTNRVHGYGKIWGKWLNNAEVVYD